MARLPNAAEAEVAQEKILLYLLNEAHERGASKAKFFRALGFHEGNWKVLESEFKRLARDCEVASVEEADIGKTFVIEGEIDTPQRGKAAVKLIWFIDAGKNKPRLITAYPGGKPS